MQPPFTTSTSVPPGTFATTSTETTSGIFKSQRYEPLIEQYEDATPPPPQNQAFRPPLRRPPTSRMEPAAQQPLIPSTTVGPPAPSATQPLLPTSAYVPQETFVATSTETTSSLCRFNTTPEYKLSDEKGSAALAYSETGLTKMYDGQNMDSITKGDQNSQTKIIVTNKKSEDNGKTSSAASESMDEDHDANNASKPTKINLSPTKEHESDKMLENGQYAQKETVEPTSRIQHAIQQQSIPFIAVATQSTTPAAPPAIQPPLLTSAYVPPEKNFATNAETTSRLFGFTTPGYKPSNEKYEDIVTPPPPKGVFIPSPIRPLTSIIRPGTQEPLIPSTAVGTQPGYAALAYSETGLIRMYDLANLDSIAKSDQNSQAKNKVSKESEENGKTSSAASESMDNEDHDANNASSSRPTKIDNLPPTKEQESNMMLGNGQEAQKETDLNKRCASQANQTGRQRKKNLEKEIINASGSDLEPEKLELERRKERKRQQNRESFRRTKLREEKDCEELGARVNNLRDENSKLDKELLSLSKDYVEITKENDSIMEELIEKYGEEAVADLMNESLLL
ncbi:hypothetical protein RIF29_32257 [Crotalaria pallida]|uniref:BZIP domain-containing protein n=1 Tax=Crotalaria pallida TaxID=3830 RepID=A0AAN9EN87_CROPI